MANPRFLLTLAVFCAAYAKCCSELLSSSQKAYKFNEPPSSCREAYVKETSAGRTPADGEYIIAYNSNGNSVVKKVYCDMTSTKCGPDKGWMRVAELDMTKPESKCPPELVEGMYGSKRLCGNRMSSHMSVADPCRSTTFDTFGFPYSEVCGFVAAYQYKSPDAFYGPASINTAYLDGISITHGTPPARKHIWSLAAGVASGSTGPDACPCNEGAKTPTMPEYVKNNWYCESGNPTDHEIYQFFPDDVLWDGKDCTLKEPPCCKNPLMPYFRTEVDGISTDSIELRICVNQGFDNEDIPIESYQFFVR